MVKEKQKKMKVHQNIKLKNGDNYFFTTSKNYLKDMSLKSGNRKMLQSAEVAS